MSRKNTTETKRTKLQFNIIDVVIIIAVIACCVGMYIRYNIGDAEGDKQEINQISAKIEFLLPEVNEQLCDVLNAGSPVYYGGDSEPIGELSTIISKLPSERFVTLNDGTIVKTFSDELYFDVRGIITVNGVMTEKGFMLNGDVFLAPGVNFGVQTPEADFSCVVTNVIIGE